MAKQAADSGGQTGMDDDARRKARRKGWLVITVVAVITFLFFALGTIDPETRYDWIKL